MSGRNARYGVRAAHQASWHRVGRGVCSVRTLDERAKGDSPRVQPLAQGSTSTASGWVVDGWAAVRCTSGRNARYGEPATHQASWRPPGSTRGRGGKNAHWRRELLGDGSAFTKEEGGFFFSGVRAAAANQRPSTLTRSRMAPRNLPANGQLPQPHAMAALPPARPPPTASEPSHQWLQGGRGNLLPLGAGW